MNAEEMARQSAARQSVVHDLNRDPRLPFGDAEFDGAMCAVSIQYLTHPVLVFRELRRVLRPGAPFVVRSPTAAFPTKAVSVWLGTSDHQHLTLVRAYFEAAGGWRDVKARTGRRTARRSAVRRVGADRMKALDIGRRRALPPRRLLFPGPRADPGEARECRRRLEAVEAAHGGRSAARCGRSRTCCSRGWPTSCATRPSSTRSRTCWARTSWCGARASSSRGRATPRSCPGTRTRPTGA